ncbi:citrulline utilization hydrolase CtlX [Vogesella indigofera]|uniref:Arginine deiminase-related protein n=1 Tax=Vogesella indigofera TaxID=45465 RepID=A0ABT5I3U6_VOGIN|nr:arginine deiminase-related protein [Vogesella indigofera]MDC7690702.1 arginine deiminase-related protein [Vogesella indigofera]
MKQTTHNIVMVRPANFFSNPETSESNRFQKPGQDDAAAQDSARAEFDGYVAALRAAGVNVLVIDDEQQGNTPDAIFPNNWISMHPDGRVFLYPMEAPNRRRERRDSVIARIRAEFAIGALSDLSAFEDEGKFLEGTGSMVFDHTNRLAYVCLSSRSHPEVLTALLMQLDYQALVFDAVDRGGAAIYHTNVMMAVGSKLAVVCLESIQPASARQRVCEQLQRHGKQIIEIDYTQMENFCGNVIELADAAGNAVFAMSSRAWHAFTPQQQATLAANGTVAHAPLDTIENLGGGGARCMVAENFLPQKQ